MADKIELETVLTSGSISSISTGGNTPADVLQKQGDLAAAISSIVDVPIWAVETVFITGKVGDELSGDFNDYITRNNSPGTTVFTLDASSDQFPIVDETGLPISLQPDGTYTGTVSAIQGGTYNIASIATNEFGADIKTNIILTVALVISAPQIQDF